MTIECAQRQPASIINMLSPLAAIPLSPSTCLGLDMVVTIATDPPFFSALAAKVKKAGGRVIVIVSRSPEARSSNMQLLGKYGVQYDDVIFMPTHNEVVEPCPYQKELGPAGSYLWQKIRVAELARITHYVNDEVGLKELFKRFLPKVTVHYPRELYPREPAAANATKKTSTPYYGAWLYHPKNPVQPPASAPWEPVKTYFVSVDGETEALYRAVTRLNGALYTDGMVVVPSSVGRAEISEALKADGGRTTIRSWTETWKWNVQGG